jgi:hypothetical protein
MYLFIVIIKKVLVRLNIFSVIGKVSINVLAFFLNFSFNSVEDDTAQTSKPQH